MALGITLLVWVLASAVVGGPVVCMLYLLCRNGPQAIKTLYAAQLMLAAAVLAHYVIKSNAEIEANPLDGPAGFFQVAEGAIAFFLATGSELFILAWLPWLIKSSSKSQAMSKTM